MLTHKGTQTIETERLILRRFRVEDAQEMYDRWASDDEVTRFLTWPTHESAEVTRQLLELWTQEYEKPDNYQWAIALKGDERPIGSIAVVACDDAEEKAEVGYCIGRAWWRQGITSEALVAVLDFLFDEVGAQRVEAKHDVNNPNSGGVMKKCGMRKARVYCSEGPNNRGMVDLCVHAIHRDEWKMRSC